METEETFEVDRSRILCVSEENQDPDLRTLGLSVYDQEALELGIRQQVDEALRDSARKRLERDIAREISCAHEDQEDSAEAPPSTSECGRLRTLRMKLRALEEERNDPSQTEEERGGHPAGESEAEKRVRLGEMTPFGSVLGGEGNGSQRADGPSAFERYLLEQSKYEELRRKGGKGKAGAKAVQRNKVVGGKSKKSPLKKSILTPKKRRKKETLGTVASDDWSDQLRAPGKLASERTALEEDSGSEYLPSGDSSGDEAQPPRKRKATAAKTRKRPEKLPEDWASDDSDWEPSDEEARTRKRARSKKEVDDGDADDYLARLKAWERSGEASGPDSDHELEGGYRIPKRLLWDKLYNYQKVGVQWLWELHRQRCGGILGDEMGLGKTVQVIAFLAGLAHGQLASRHGGYRGLGPVLVVCPTTVMHQWVKEFHQWWPRFRVAVLHESGSFAGRREVLIRNVNKDNGILVTSYVGVVQHREALVAREWHYVILDEGHKIRNPDAKVTLAVKMFRTPHRLILSGSPMQNSLQELWSLFDFAFPGKLGTLPVFLAQLATPITQGGYANASEVQVAAAHRCATVLKDTISPYLLRRVKADVRAHAKLPPKTEQVLFCGLSEEQRRLYKGYLESGAVERILQGQAKIFVGLINLRKICNHPDLYSGGPKLFRGENEEDLPEESRYGHWKKSGKMIVLESLLKIWKRQGHRVLLFTQSRQMLCILEDFVQKREYRYLKLDGGTSVAARQPLIAKFNQDPSFFVFLLTTRVGGLGVNLTGADRVVVYDPDWNPATDSQARERAWRIGQRNQVTVYRLVTAGTIEEKIYHRQIFKQFLTNKVLQDPKQRRFFKSNDLFELFTLKESDQKGSTETSAIFAGTGSEVTANHLKARRKELKSKIRSTADVTFSRAKVERMKELAHKLSQKIGQLSGREPKKRKPKRGATFEGERVPFLVGRGEQEEEKDEEVDQEQDDYVLRKLFKKSGLQTALRHDAIVGGGGADYALVEGEARKVAREAVEALKESRRECFGAGAGVPTWTGRHGALRARFGKKKSELLSVIENRKRPFPGWKDPDLADRVRAFVAARGEASTGELVDNFKGGLPPEGTPLFKFLLQEICTFHRTPTGVGVWKLKAEFK